MVSDVAFNVAVDVAMPQPQVSRNPIIARLGRWGLWVSIMGAVSFAPALLQVEPSEQHSLKPSVEPSVPLVSAFVDSVLSPPVAIAAEARSMPISTPQEAVNRFAADTQLYVQGSPLSPDEIARLQAILSANPNIYVVLIDYSANVVADDLLLSRGIGESEAFRSGYNAQLDQRDGVLLMVYFDSNQGRKIFMRSEELPDRLGVGEANFATKSGQPRELLNLFVNAVRNDGKAVPEALEVVINRINGTISAAAQKVAEQKVAEQNSQQQETSPPTQQTPPLSQQPVTTIPSAPPPGHSVASSVADETDDYAPWLGALMLLGSLTPAGILNRRARKRKKQAQEQFAETQVAIDQATQSLLKLVERADYALLNQYQGQTQALAQQLTEDLGDAMALVGGTAKFTNEAEQLIEHSGIGGQLRTVGYERAIALLTDPETKLSFDLNDSTRAAFAQDSNADTWRTMLLQQGKERTFEKSLQDVLQALDENQSSASQLLDEIQTKATGIEGFLQRIETDSEILLNQLQQLRSSQPEQPFVLESLLSQTLPKILAPTEGLIAQGRRYMLQDPVRAWDEMGEEAQRILTKATRLSEQDRERREVCLGLIETAEKAIATARQSLFDQLQQHQAFRQGKPEQLLREPNQDPSARTLQAQEHLQQLARSLQQEDTERSEQHITTLKALTQEAHQLCQSTQAALTAYPGQLQQHQADYQTTLQQINQEFQPTLQQLQQQYHHDALAQVATDVQSGATIEDNVDNAKNLLSRGLEALRNAGVQFDGAQILTAVASLDEGERLLQSGQRQLRLIVEAETHLNQLQAVVMAEVARVDGKQVQLEQTAEADYLRSPARLAIEQAAEALEPVHHCATATPPNPYAIQAALAQYETARAQAETAAQKDKQAYEAAIASLNQAERAIDRARSEVASAGLRHFSHARVSTYTAEQELRQARNLLEEAQQSMQPNDYEQAREQADQAKSKAKQAERSAEDAVRRARRKHDAEVRRREQARRAAQQAAQQAAAQAAASSWSSSSSASSGGSGGGGGGGSSSDSGSTGGSW